MQDLAAAIVTWRDDGTPGRRASLDATLARLARVRGLDVVVVEQDALPRVAPPLVHPRARVLFAYNDGPFHAGWGNNVGVRATAANVIVFGDLDVLPPDTLETAVAQAARGWAIVKPTRGRVVLSTADSSEVRANPAARPDAAAAARGTPEEDVLCGGWFAIRRAAYFRLGGFDERCADGGVRHALSLRVERLRLPTLELHDEPAFRLAPSSAEESRSAAGEPEASAALVDALDDDALARLGEVQAQSCGGRDKYRPGGWPAA